MIATLLAINMLRAGSVHPQAQNFVAPQMSGGLIQLDEKLALTSFKTDHAKISLTNWQGKPALKAEFDSATAYPKVEFPVPNAGWNLNYFGGVRAEITNPGKQAVRIALRVDNPGKWEDSPWNTGIAEVGPGQTSVLSLKFGESGYPLDSSKVSAIQIFLPTPKEGATVLVSKLEAFGSPADVVKSGNFSTPADRNKPVVPPAWVGKRPPVEGSWVPTLNENFDGDKLNTKIWSHETWWNGLLGGQTQAYSPSMSTFKNGILTMKFEKKTIHQNDDPALPTREYATGHMVSFNKWAQKYGYFEARIKPPKARGLWPAFWLMPDRGPAAGPEGWKRESTKDGGMEIDIMEILTEWGPGRNNVAVHWDGYEADHKTWGNSNLYFGPTPDGFHTFGLLWEPGKLTWYIDGTKKAEYKSDRVGSTAAYIILNIQSGSWATKNVDVASLPDQMQVDWIRCWQLKERLAK